ncbi:CLUMA_CG016825, isoform A [Clunio marinus]|uniref:CLUMA_CG016825, isoform A n=1 Tax=Clunio marinus TaxID=568069 RepID=A0A1J1IU13_9DIPT|nr:CLUMA_CG016825, isoform A [Clunio marinus]
MLPVAAWQRPTSNDVDLKSKKEKIDGKETNTNITFLMVIICWDNALKISNQISQLKKLSVLGENVPGSMMLKIFLISHFTQHHDEQSFLYFARPLGSLSVVNCCLLLTKHPTLPLSHPPLCHEQATSTMRCCLKVAGLFAVLLVRDKPPKQPQSR